jgi:hypothetical protein
MRHVCVAVTAAGTKYFVILLGPSKVGSLNLSVWCQRAKYGKKLMITARGSDYANVECAM